MNKTLKQQYTAGSQFEQTERASQVGGQGWRMCTSPEDTERLGRLHWPSAMSKRVAGKLGGICLLFNLPSVKPTTASISNQAIHQIPIETVSITSRPKADSGPHAIQKSGPLPMYCTVGLLCSSTQFNWTRFKLGAVANTQSTIY